MPSTAQESVSWEAERRELDSVLKSPLFTRSPTLTHLLSYLCEKTFQGKADQIKEYSVALDVFDRAPSFDQDTDSIVRVQANRLRKRLGEYYAKDGASHAVRISIPVGQYIPLFEKTTSIGASNADTPPEHAAIAAWLPGNGLLSALAAVILTLLLLAGWLIRERPRPHPTVISPSADHGMPEPVGLPVGEEIRILSGATRKYVDHAGKIWSPDACFSGGSAVQSSIQHIWRTQDPIIYRASRQGEFTYDIPLKPGVYELRLHFAETFYGPENSGAGGEGSRLMTVTDNGQPLLRDFDPLADAGGDRTADVKVFSDVSPAPDGRLHLGFSSPKAGSAMLSALEILPGVRGRIRPVRILARDVPYYSNDSQWWSPDAYFKGGQLSSSQEPAQGVDDPEFYETERWGHFSYAIPVTPGRYTVTLHFIEHHRDTPDRPGSEASGERVFNVFCNGKAILSNLNIKKQAGENHPLVRKIKNLEPNAQGKLLLEFVPVKGYATVTAIEVVPE